MKLLQAICKCGFRTRKARVGYHFHQWWFPMFNIDTKQLTDVFRVLPADQIDLIQRSKVKAVEFHQPYLESIASELLNEYADRSDVVFNPAIGSTLVCPECRQKCLRVDQVRVTAYCKRDCGLEYQWQDSEEHGCPKCNYRPHGFQVDLDLHSARKERVVSSCPCSSSMESASHIDAYCPKCGALPTRYRIDGHAICGLHHVEMQEYQVPGNCLFMQPIGWLAERTDQTDQFPNAKPWGDAETDDFIVDSYCPLCESNQQNWIATNDIE